MIGLSSVRHISVRTFLRTCAHREGNCHCASSAVTRRVAHPCISWFAPQNSARRRQSPTPRLPSALLSNYQNKKHSSHLMHSSPLQQLMPLLPDRVRWPPSTALPLDSS